MENVTVIRTFLIADVRGYTRFTQAHGDEEAGKLATRFAALAREEVTAAGGEVIELRGDEVLCAFPSARQALRGAVELQRRFRERVDGEPVFPLGIGIGLDAGEAVPVEGGYRGGALNLAARLCSVAAPGQILASETVASLAQTFEGVRFVARRARVKGLERPVRLIEVVPIEPLPPVPEAPEPSKRRQGLVVISAGALLLLAAAAAAVLALTRDSDNSIERVGNAIAAIDRDGAAVAYTRAGNAPSTIAVGEGSVWVLNADDRTISKLDPETREIVKTFGTGGTTTDLAVGAGSVWVGNGAEIDPLGNVYTDRVFRLDPGSTVVVDTFVLPGAGPRARGDHAGSYRVPGVRQLAVGAGAVWAINPDLSVSRIDPASGELVKIPLRGFAVAAGREGVWLLVPDAAEVVRVNPGTNRAGQRIAVEGEGFWGIAVGAGSVWATDLVTGLLWRIEPGADPITRTIDVGFGATALAYGGGAVWVTNFVRDEVVRVDTQTNRVTARVPLAGTPPAVAATEDTAWVSIAGAPSSDVLPASSCGPVVAGGGQPDVLIASDLPLQGSAQYVTRAAADAVRFVLRERGFRAGRFTVGYQSCDDSTAQQGSFDFLKCASNAKAYAATPRLVGVIGPFDSGCAWAQIPIANRAEGPLPMISPSNSQPSLTHAAPGVSENEPELYYPTGARNYVRVIASEDFHAAGAAVLARELGLRRLYVLESTRKAFPADFATYFKRSARKLGLTIAGSAEWEPDAKSYGGRAARVARARPDGIFFADLYFENPDAVLSALRQRLGPEVVLITGESAGHAAPGMYLTTTARANESLSRAGRRFVREFAATRPNGVAPSAKYLPEAAQAAEVLLEAIERSDGTRASVNRELRRLEIEDGILGSFRFDRNGDMTPPSITVFRVTGEKDKADAPEIFGGADFDRLVRVPPELVGS